MNDPDALSGGKFRLYERAKASENSAFVDLEGPSYMDICQHDRFLNNGVQVAIKLWPNRDSFCLMSAENEQNTKFTLKTPFCGVATSKLTRVFYWDIARLTRNTQRCTHLKNRT